MITAQQHDEITELVLWYVQDAKTPDALRALADEIAFLKTAVPLRKKDLDRIKMHYIKKQRDLRESAPTGPQLVAG